MQYLLGMIRYCVRIHPRDESSYLYKACPPCSRHVCHPSPSPSSPASWAPSSLSLRASSWSWSPPGSPGGWGWPRLSFLAETCRVTNNETTVMRVLTNEMAILGVLTNQTPAYLPSLSSWCQLSCTSSGFSLRPILLSPDSWIWEYQG